MIVGCNFCDLLSAEEDCTRFKNALLRSRGTVSDPEAQGDEDMVQVHLCDRYNSRFGVYAYNAGIFGSVSGLCHTVAIVEAGERDAFSAEQIVPPLVPLEVQPEYTNSVPSEASASNADTLTSAHSTLQESQNDLAVWVNIDTSDLSIEQCSVGFTAFGPVLQGTGLKDWFQCDCDEEDRDDAWANFVDWVQCSLEQLLEIHDQHTPNEVLQLFASSSNHTRRVKLCNPSLSSLLFSAKCKVDIDAPLPPSMQTRINDTVRLIFMDIKRSKKKRRRRARSASPLTSSLLSL